MSSSGALYFFGIMLFTRAVPCEEGHGSPHLDVQDS